MEETTLYRKHRPQSLADVSGQKHILAVLKNALAEGKITHAYLFAGPRGTGKTTIARIMAKRLNCQNPQGSEPCGTCSNCVAFAQKSGFDLIEIDAASNRGIDEIRALKDRIGFVPVAGKYKIYIVDEVHMLTKEAFNALLKTLEEPPSHAIFILATTELHKVPETIRSRCQTFLFRRAAVAQIIERLKKIASAEKVEIDESALNLIANHSEGCFRDAESLFGQVISMKNENITETDVQIMLGVVGFAQIQEFAEYVLQKNAKKAIEKLQQAVEGGNSLRRFADDITRYLRAVASYAAAGIHSETFDLKTEEKLKEQSKKYMLGDFVKLLRLFLRAKTEMRDATYEEMPLELAIIEWCDSGANKTGGNPSSFASNQAASGVGKAPQVQKIAIDETKPHGTSLLKVKPASLEENNHLADNPALLEKVMVVWQDFLDRTSGLNPLLVSTLEQCKPAAARGNILYLVTEFSLYKERVSDNKVREPLEKLLEEIAGEKILLRTLSKSEAVGMNIPTEVPANSAISRPAAANPPQNTTADALSILGGELVGG